MMFFTGLFAVMLAAGALQPEILAVQDLIARGKLGAARKRVAVALREHPRAGGLYNLLGIIDAKQNRLGSAETNFERAIRLEPHLAVAYLNLGRAQVLEMDTDARAASRAEATFRRLLAFQPGQREAGFLLAQLLEWRGAFEESLRQLSRLPEDERKRARSLAIRCADLAATEHEAEAGQIATVLAEAADLSEAGVVPILPALETRRQYALAVRLLQALDRRQLT